MTYRCQVFNAAISHPCASISECSPTVSQDKAHLLPLPILVNRTHNQTKVDVRKPGQQLSTLDRSTDMSLPSCSNRPLAGKHPMRVTKHQTPTRKSARLEAIRHFKERSDSKEQDPGTESKEQITGTVSKEQNTEQHPFSSPSVSNSRSSVCPLLALILSIET